MTPASKILLLLRRLDCNDGVSSYCETLIGSLIEQGCEIHVACGVVYHTPTTISRYERMRSLATSWTEIGEAGQIPNWHGLRAAAKTIREAGIDIVNVQGFGALAWGWMLRRLTGRPVVATYLPSAPGGVSDVVGADERPMSAKQRVFLRLFMPDRVISLSEKSTDYIVSQSSALQTRIATVYGGIDTDHFRLPSPEERASARAQLGLTERTLMCLLVGRLDWNKGQDLLIKAIRQVRNDLGRPIHCFIVGSGHDEMAIRAAASEQPGDDETITVLGHVSDVRDVAWAADIFVLPSRLEGFGLVVVEAMACGAVPIRTPSGGATDQIISGINGYIVPFEDVDALAEAIRSLADDDRRSTFAKAGLSRIRERFDRRVIARQVGEVFAQAITGRTR